MEKDLQRQMLAVHSKDDWKTRLPRGGLQLSDVSFDADSSSYDHIDCGSNFWDGATHSCSFIDDVNDSLGSASLLDDAELEMAFEAEQLGRSRAGHIFFTNQQRRTPPVEIPGRVQARRACPQSPQHAGRKTAMWMGKERRLLQRRRSVKEQYLSDSRAFDFDEEDDCLFKMEF